MNFFSYSFYLLQSGSPDPTEILIMAVNVSLMFAWLFIYCEFGERVTHEFNQFNEKLCHCNWYSFSIEMKRIFLITISGTQEPAVVQGFANTTCTRDAFKTVNFSLKKVQKIKMLLNLFIKLSYFLL